MSRDSSGVYTLPAGNPVVSDTTISSTVQNNTMSDLGAEMQNSLDRGGRGNMTVPLELLDGSAAAPSYTYIAETNSGWHRAAAGTHHFSVLGTDMLILTATGIAINNAAGPAILNEAATATNPPLVPNKADLDTGVGWTSANVLSLVAGGVSTLAVSATGISLAGTLTAVGGISVFSRADTTPNGIASTSADDLVVGSTGTANTGMTLFGSTKSTIYFLGGNFGGAGEGSVTYTASTNKFTFSVGAGAADTPLSFDSNGVDVAGDLDVSGVVELTIDTVATIPTASNYEGGIIFVSNGAAGSPVLAFSDGTNWLRCDTLAAVAAS